MLHFTRIVAHANHDGAHGAQRGVTHDGDLVGRAVGVVLGEGLGVGGYAQRLLLVAVLLGTGEDVEVDVDEVVGGPYLACAVFAVGVLPLGCDGEGYFVFVVVVLIVRAHTQEERGLSVFHRLFARQRVGVGEELQVLVAAQVEVGVLVGSACIA